MRSSEAVETVIELQLTTDLLRHALAQRRREWREAQREILLLDLLTWEGSAFRFGPYFHRALQHLHLLEGRMPDAD
jgi:hypothetical protein